MTLLILPSYPPTGSGSSMFAFGFLLWACLIGLGTAWIFLAGQLRLPFSVSSRRPSWSRLLSPRRLERQILQAVVRFAILDVRGIRLLPDQVTVVLSPAELGALGPLADFVAENVAHSMDMLVREDRYSLAAEPIVTLVASGTQRSGRPVVLTCFGVPVTRRAAGAPGPPGGEDGDPAVLRRLEPPGRPLLLRSNHVRLGRHGCDLVVPEAAVSRRHASVYRRADGWYLLDHRSTNGTFINGSRVAEPVKLADGDEIRLGRWVRLRFELSPLWAA